MVHVNMHPERTLVGWLCRHAELNISHKWDGWGRFAISEEGRQSMEKTAQWLSFERIGRIVSSDLPRAVQSADILMSGCNIACPYVMFEPNLRSWAIGQFTGKEKTPERKAEFQKYINDPNLVIPEGESHNQLEERIQIIDQYLASPYEGLPTLCVLHNSSIKARMGINHPGDVVDPAGLVSVYLNEKGEFEYEIALGKTDFDVDHDLEFGKFGMYSDS